MRWKKNSKSGSSGAITAAKSALAHMAKTIRLRVEFDDDNITVTLPGTTFRVIYRKAREGSGLVPFGVRGDEDSGMSQVDFLARAWRVANDKAKELGWIV
jgi:hypothetical protein